MFDSFGLPAENKFCEEYKKEKIHRIYASDTYLCLKT